MASYTTIDYESSLIRPGLLLPPPACAVTYSPADGCRIWPSHRLEEMWERVCDSGDQIGGHDWARFDAGIAAAWHPRLRARIWDLFESGRAWDSLVAQRIIQIQRGSIGPLNQTEVAKANGIDLPDKSDEEQQRVRLTFGQYIGRGEISDAHREYLLRDGWAPHQIHARQLETGLVSQRDLKELCMQSFWLGLVAAQGFRTDPEHVRIFAQRVQEHIQVLNELATEAGFLRPDGTKDTQVLKYAVCAAYCPEALVAFGIAKPEELDQRRERAFVAWLRSPECPYANRIPLSKSEQSIGTDKVVKADSGDDALELLATWDQWRSAANKDVELLFRGAVEPVHSRFSITNTLRSATSDPNQQNFGKGHRPDPELDLIRAQRKLGADASPDAIARYITARHQVWGTRECIAPRPGRVLATTDAKGLENCSLAQCIIWRTGIRTFADKVNTGRDLHAEVGAVVLGYGEDEAAYQRIQAQRDAKRNPDPRSRLEAEDARDCGKPGNFGKAGGMKRWQTLQSYARRGYGITMSDERAQAVNAAVERMMARDGRGAWLESCDWYRNELGRYDIPLCERLTDIVRRNVSRTDCANNPFQYLGMRVMNRAGWLLTRAQYLTGECPGRCVMFVHDSLDSECEPEDADDVARYQEWCIEQAGRELCPDVRFAGDSRVLTHGSKGVKAKRTEDGRLIVARVEV